MGTKHSIFALCGRLVASGHKRDDPHQLLAAGSRSIFFYLMLLIFNSTFGHVYALASNNCTVNQKNTPNQISNASVPLECLQVTAPISNPPGSCQQILMTHTFGYSYGQPFIGYYNPPECSFTRVTFNFTVTSSGRQFDRLGLMFLGDIEVFRTSTAEPTKNGIIWSYTKDMTSFLSLLKVQQKIIFDLGNLVDDTYTGVWHTQLTAKFFTDEEPFHAADLIIPISAGKSATNESSAFSVPEQSAASTLVLPINMKKAVFSVAACGQSTEEFWWSNVLSSTTGVFGNETQLYGHSAFRELQLLIDGKLAGVAWPFPIIFTGGIVPGFWRPIVGIDAFDLREDEIDITPFLPILNDGREHTFQIRVVGIDDNGQGIGTLTEAIGSSWIVTGKIFVWLENGTANTTGRMTTISAPEPVMRLQSVTSGQQGAVDILSYSVNITREIYIESTLYTSEGATSVNWKQSLNFYNAGTLQNKGNDQVVQQLTTCNHGSSSGYRREIRYPLWVTSSYQAYSNGNVTIWGEQRRGKNVVQVGDLAFPNDWRTFDYSRLPSLERNIPVSQGSMLSNWQNGTASYASVPAQKTSYGTGSTEQTFGLSRLIKQHGMSLQSDTSAGGGTLAPVEELYSRHILAANNSVVYDNEKFGGQTLDQACFSSISRKIPWTWLHEFAVRGVQALIGRGPV